MHCNSDQYVCECAHVYEMMHLILCRFFFLKTNYWIFEYFNGSEVRGFNERLKTCKNHIDSLKININFDWCKNFFEIRNCCLVISTLLIWISGTIKNWKIIFVFQNIYFWSNWIVWFLRFIHKTFQANDSYMPLVRAVRNVCVLIKSIQWPMTKSQIICL